MSSSQDDTRNFRDGDTWSSNNGLNYEDDGSSRGSPKQDVFHPYQRYRSSYDGSSHDRSSYDGSSHDRYGYDKWSHDSPMQDSSRPYHRRRYVYDGSGQDRLGYDKSSHDSPKQDAPRPYQRYKSSYDGSSRNRFNYDNTKQDINRPYQPNRSSNNDPFFAMKKAWSGDQKNEIQEVEATGSEGSVEPMYNGFQLVGDSQFVRFSEQILKKPRKFNNGLAYIGLCVSGQKTGELLERVQSDFHSVTKNCILMIGTNDLTKKTSMRELLSNYLELVEELVKKGAEKLLLVTVPPVPRMESSEHHWKDLSTYNDFIKKIPDHESAVLRQAEIKVCDAFTSFVYKSDGSGPVSSEAGPFHSNVKDDVTQPKRHSMPIQQCNFSIPPPNFKTPPPPSKLSSNSSYQVSGWDYGLSCKVEPGNYADACEHVVIPEACSNAAIFEHVSYDCEGNVCEKWEDHGARDWEHKEEKKLENFSVNVRCSKRKIYEEVTMEESSPSKHAQREWDAMQHQNTPKSTPRESADADYHNYEYYDDNKWTTKEAPKSIVERIKRDHFEEYFGNGNRQDLIHLNLKGFRVLSLEFTKAIAAWQIDSERKRRNY